MCHLWLILESQPVDDSSSICSNACLTSTHLESTCTDGFNPQSSRRVNSCKLLTMAQCYMNLNLKRVRYRKTDINSFALIWFCTGLEDLGIARVKTLQGPRKLKIILVSYFPSSIDWRQKKGRRVNSSSHKCLHGISFSYNTYVRINSKSKRLMK